MSKFKTYCSNCRTTTLHNGSNMSGECLNCDFSEDALQEVEEDDRELEWIDDSYEERRESGKTHGIR